MHAGRSVDIPTDRDIIYLHAQKLCPAAYLFIELPTMKAAFPFMGAVSAQLSTALVVDLVNTPTTYKSAHQLDAVDSISIEPDPATIPNSTNPL